MSSSDLQSKDLHPGETAPAAECADALQASHQLSSWWERLDTTPDDLPLPSDLVVFPRLRRLQQTFGLTAFETSMLLLLAIAELEPGCSERLTHDEKRLPSFEDFQHLFPRFAHAKVLLSGGAFISSRLLSLHDARLQTLPRSRRALVIDDRVLSYLMGDDSLDERLAPYINTEMPDGVLTPAQAACAEHLASLWQQATHFDSIVPVFLTGPERESLAIVAATAARQVGLGFSAFAPGASLAPSTERAELVRLWRREALLGQRMLYLDAWNPNDRDALADWATSCGGAMAVGMRDQNRSTISGVCLKVPATSDEDRRQLLASVLNGQASTSPGLAVRLAEQFRVGASRLFVALSRHGPENRPITAHELWEICRREAASTPTHLVQRIESGATWIDLVLPPDTLELLHEIAAQARWRAKVHEEWGFADRGTRGLNLTALFSGPSGTGKTMAAEVIANELRLDLLRVDLSAVVSKYIGETEEHLSEVFDAAEAGGSVLLFDESDALFGQRSKIHDSRDRHANIEVSFLLQRLEAFRGVAILTTNFRENLDAAFLRRIRFHVEFPFPDRLTRAQLWRSVFPNNTPLAQVDFEKLSRLSLTGGHIRNIALNAAFRAAEAGTPVRPEHIVAAARNEFRKSEKPAPEAALQALLQPATEGGV